MTAIADGTAFIELSEIDSTNLEARRRADAGERGPMWLRADKQNAGRGRDGRHWVSEIGNLYTTHLFVVTCPPSATPQLSLVAGVALIDALSGLGVTRETVPGLRLKWPNDVLVGQDKLAGILAESFVAGDGDRCVMIGFGVNLQAPPSSLDRPVAGLSQFGYRFSPNDLLLALAREVARWRDIWDNGDGFERVRSAWLAAAGQIDHAISVRLPDGAQYVGRFAGLDTDGALLMLEAAQQKVLRITFGDVSDGFHDLAPRTSGPV